MTAAMLNGKIAWTQHRQLRVRAAALGALAALLMLAVYFAVLWWANSLDHALTELADLWYWMLPLVGGFALQVGLFSYARLAARGARSRGVVASGGLSTMSMVACCAHHLTDVLPFVGLAGASLFLAEYKTIFLSAGLASNVVGVAYMLRLFRKHGLAADRGGLLARVLRLRFDVYFPWIISAAVIGFAAVVLYELWTGGLL
jgi:hypothetical protein